MSRKNLDGSALDECNGDMRERGTLDDPAGLQHVDTEYLGRLLQLPTAKPVQATADASELDLRSVDRLDGVV